MGRFFSFIGLFVGFFSVVAVGYCQGQANGSQQASSAAVPDAKQPLVQQFDDWFYRCIEQKSDDGSVAKQCEVAQIQQVKRGEETITVLTMAIALTAPEKKGGKPGLLLTSVAPLNVFLPAGLIYLVNDKEAMKLAYRNCNQAGCWAQQRLDSKVLAAFKKTQGAVARFRLLTGQNVNVQFSLKGLSQALEALEKGGI